MKRRIDDLTGRPESVSGVVGAGVTGGGSGVAPANAASSLGAVTGYVRGTTTVGQPVGRSGGPGQGAPVPGVVPVPATSVGTVSAAGGPVVHDHQTHNPSQTG